MVKRILHIMLLTYFILAALFFTSGALISFFVFIAGKLENLTLYTPISTIVFGLTFFYGANLLFNNKHKGYTFSAVVLPLLYILTTLHRFFFISNLRFEYIDFNNLILLAIPFLISVFLLFR